MVFSGDSPRNAPADLLQYPTFLDRIAKSGGTPKYARPMCTSALKPKADNTDFAKGYRPFSKCPKDPRWAGVL